MKLNSDSMDTILKKALSSTEAPDDELNLITKNRMKERMVLMNKSKKLPLRVLLIAAAVVVFMSVSAYALVSLLSADKYADTMGFPALADAFRSKDAVKINESIESDGYKVTLIGITSGKGLTNLTEDGGVEAEKSYAVLAIEKKDGKMPATNDPNYNNPPFFVSPLIKGLLPWQINIASIGNGGYVESVIDGIMYRLIECDSIEMFADRGVYLAVSSSLLYDTKAYTYDFDTGGIAPNADYKGLNILFDLPLDKSKADPQKAKQFLDGFYGGYDKFVKEQLPEIRKSYLESVEKR